MPDASRTLRQDAESRVRTLSSNASRRGISSTTSALFLFLVAAFLPGAAFAQQPGGETRIPTKIGKIRGGSDQQAFTGKVVSVDAKLKVLNVKAEEGTGAEIFPIKKNVLLKSAQGEKLQLSDLKAGTDVVIYYELKNNQRVVKQIILLSPKPEEAKKKNSPTS